MESLIIAAPCVYDVEFRERLEGLGPVGVGAAGIVFLDDGRSRVYINRADSVQDELEPERLKVFSDIVGAVPIFYAVDFTDITLCRKVLIAIADDPRLLVDNDHDVLLAGDEFVRVLRSRTDWDWRRDVP